jgi:hypothetical protein
MPHTWRPMARTAGGGMLTKRRFKLEVTAPVIAAANPCPILLGESTLLARIHLTAIVVMTLEVFLCSTTMHAQQLTGTPGSPSATTTIDGKQLPAPEPKFGGVIKRTAPESKAWWPPQIVPPKGAPTCS